MHKKHKVAGTAEEVLARQATTRADLTGDAFEGALRAVLGTEAGRQPRELRDGSHHHERAEDWQADIARRRAVEQAEALGMPLSGGVSEPFQRGE